MSSTYTKINWQDYPSKQTPISAENLNHMDDQIKQNADDVDDIKDNITGLQNIDADLQQQIDQKTIDDINVAWTNNLLSPDDTAKQIGKYNNGPYYHKNYYAEVDNDRQEQYEFDITDIVAYSSTDGSKGHITDISGVISCSDGKVYPVGYIFNNTWFLVTADEENKTLKCVFPGTAAGTNLQRKRTIMLTVRYRKYYP